MRTRLSRRYAPPEVDGTIEALKAQGLLDDLAFARFWRESRERQHPKGALALRWELRRMGVAGDAVEQALDGLDEEDGAYRAGSKIAHRLGKLEQEGFRKKLSAYLRRRGFRPLLVRETVARLWAELSDPADSHINGGGYEQQ